jgi:hypothetical protein
VRTWHDAVAFEVTSATSRALAVILTALLGNAHAVLTITRWTLEIDGASSLGGYLTVAPRATIFARWTIGVGLAHVAAAALAADLIIGADAITRAIVRLFGDVILTALPIHAARGVVLGGATFIAPATTESRKGHHQAAHKNPPQLCGE